MISFVISLLEKLYKAMGLVSNGPYHEKIFRGVVGLSLTGVNTLCP